MPSGGGGLLGGGSFGRAPDGADGAPSYAPPLGPCFFGGGAVGRAGGASAPRAMTGAMEAGGGPRGALGGPPVGRTGGAPRGRGGGRDMGLAALAHGGQRRAAVLGPFSLALS